MKKALFINLVNLFADQHGVYSLTSAMRQHGIEVYYIKGINRAKALRLISEIDPDILLYSSLSMSIPAYIEFDKHVKGITKARSLIGGPGPTFDWECINGSSIDNFCIGEGEHALVDFIKSDFSANKNIFHRGERPSSGFYELLGLDSLPFPDRGIIYRYDSLLRGMLSKQFISGRGCPYECTYCFNHVFKDMFKNCGDFVRKKSVDYLFDEIRDVKKHYPITNVVFSDDTFILNKAWLMEFCARFPKELSLTYACNIRANLVDEESIRAMKESGCIGVNWSIESGDTYLRNSVLKRGISNEQILNTAHLLKKYKIPCRIGNVIGLPGESFEHMLKTLELNILAKPYYGFTSIFMPYPGLELTRYAIEKGYYNPSGNIKLSTLHAGCMMNVSSFEKTRVMKLCNLFFLFVRHPFLYYSAFFRRILFALPLFITAVPYSLCYGYFMMRIYVPQQSFLNRCRMILRYFVNMLCKVE